MLTETAPKPGIQYSDVAGIRQRIVAVLVLTFALLYSLPTLSAQNELHLKAAFVFKFCEYVKWPEFSFADSSSPFVIGVAESKEQVVPVLNAASKQYKGTRPIQIQLVKPGDDVADLHVLFFPASTNQPIENYLDSTLMPHILTITDKREYSEMGVINFIIVNERIRFQISQQHAERANLVLSSQLLSVAHKVYMDE